MVKNEQTIAEEIEIAKKVIPELLRQGLDGIPKDEGRASKIKITVTVKFKPLEVGVSVEF